MNVQLVNRICLWGLIVIVALIAWGKILLHPSRLSMPSRMGDYSLNTGSANETWEQRQYPPHFHYPIPAVLLWRLFGLWNFPVGALAWLLILPTSMIGSMLLTGLLSSDCKKYTGLIMALAFAGTEYYLMWDLRAINANSFYLLLIMLGCWYWHKDKKIWAGVLLGGSVAFKIYSVVFLFYLILRKEWCIGTAMVTSMLVFFVGVPALFLGWQDTILLSGEWIKFIHATSNANAVLTHQTYKVSLKWVAMLLMNPEASAGKLNFFNCSMDMVVMVVRSVCVAWALMVAGYFLTTRPVKPHQNVSRLAFVLDISVLLFCPFPASSFLEPHHLVVMVVPAIALIYIMCDARFLARYRAIAGLTVGMGACLTELGPHYPLRGVGVMLTLLVYLIGIWILRYFAFNQPCEPSKISSSTLC